MAAKLYDDTLTVMGIYDQIVDIADIPFEEPFEAPAFAEYAITVGDIRKMKKANKYTMPLLQINGGFTLHKANDNDKYVLNNILLSSIEGLDTSPKDSHKPFQEEIMLKVSAKLLKTIVKVIKETIKVSIETKYMPPNDIEYVDRVVKELDDIIAAPKKAKKDAAAPKKTKKDDAQKAKIVETKELIKELKKVAKDAKKAADVAQKTLEKAEKALAKLLA
jgi:hypothetical protein